METIIISSTDYQGDFAVWSFLNGHFYSLTLLCKKWGLLVFYWANKQVIKERNRKMDSLVQEHSNKMYKSQVWRIIGQTVKEIMELDLTGKKLKEHPVAKAWRNENMMTQMHYNTKPIKSNMVLLLVERTQV